MSDLEHTPTPWEVRSLKSRFTHDKEVVGIFGPSEIVHDLDGIAVPDRLNDRSFVEDASNMNFIVKAVNNHDALVSALEAMTEGYCSLVNTGDCGFWDPETEDEVKNARAALSQAKEDRT